MKTETEFDKENYRCPFRTTKCIKDGCTHFDRSNCNHYYWGNEITIYDDGKCHAGGSTYYLWQIRYNIKPAYKSITFKECYEILRNKGKPPLIALILALDYDEKIPYDFDEIRRMIRSNTFDPKILPLKKND